MTKIVTTNQIARRLKGGTALALVALFASGAVASAQEATTATNTAPAPKAVTSGNNSDSTVVVITGTRASERSAIDRKKKAKTATDSIVAEDVGKFPDKNIGEAISRIAGVAVDRGAFNEGGGVTLRGVNSDQTNVEIDGMGVQNTTVTDNISGVAGNQDGRGKTFADYPADLIKSVDVVKGSTAAMTEGGIGGSILVQTRTGLDFKKPYVSLRFDNTANSLGRNWTPEWNLIMARKFMDGHLGILFNYTNSTIINDADQEQPQTSGTQGLARLADFDNSPNKTFTFNPSTVDATSTAPVASGSSIYAFDNPLGLVTKSANAKTKADCYAAFPMLTPTQIASFGTPTSTAAVTARTAQTNELATCLSQWNDYTPSLIRFLEQRDVEHRQALDLRADYKINDDLTVFAKLSLVANNTDNYQQTYTLGGFTVNNQNVGTPSFQGVSYFDTGGPLDTAAYTRNAVANSGYYIYNGVQPQAALGSAAATGALVNGIAVNVVPDSTLVIDSTHHVTNATITDGTVNTDQIHNTNNYFSKYLTTGGHFHHDNLTIDFMAGDAQSKYTRYDKRLNLQYTYGPATVSLVPGSGLWTITPLGTFNQTDPSLYSIVRPATAGQAAKTPTGADPGYPAGTAAPVSENGAYTVAQMPWVSNNIGLQWSPKESDTEQKRAKIDLTYNIDNKLPFITSVQTGYQYNEDIAKGWGGGGITITPENQHYVNGVATTPYGTAGYVPPVVLPTTTLRGTVRACDDTRYGVAGTAAPAGALPCNYGYVPSSALSNDRYGVLTLTPADLQTVASQAFTPAWYTFMNGLPDRGGLFNGWSQLAVDKIYNMIGQESQNPKYATGGSFTQNYNFNCIKVCTASDGKQYAMPFSASDEKTSAGYLMVEFEQKLPFNMVFNGNVGQRYVKTDVNASGYVTLTDLRCTNSANCGPSTSTSGTTSLSASARVAINKTTTDWMPSYNYNLWMIPDQLVFRYYGARVISRPPIYALLPAGTCTFDQRQAAILSPDGSVTGSCTQFGNPSLKPFQSRNHNWSLEWYPNKDDQFSVELFKNQIITGAPINSAATNVNLFAGLDINDPATAASLSNVEVSYPTYVNGNAFTRKGIEIAGKVAFTFLPWYFKYLGADGNYATVHASNVVGGVRDLITGDSLPPQGESSYYGNLSLWYDDGTTTARLAYQARDEYFRGIAPEGNATSINNYPANGVTPRPIPYNIGSPNFQEKTQYLDFKINHKLNKEYEAFFQVTNILKQSAVQYQGTYNAYSDGTPVINNLTYPGYRVTVGFSYKH